MKKFTGLILAVTMSMSVAVFADTAAPAFATPDEWISHSAHEKDVQFKAGWNHHGYSENQSRDAADVYPVSCGYLFIPSTRK